MTRYLTRDELMRQKPCAEGMGALITALGPKTRWALTEKNAREAAHLLTAVDINWAAYVLLSPRRYQSWLSMRKAAYAADLLRGHDDAGFRDYVADLAIAFVVLLRAQKHEEKRRGG